jgi:hypothetical protein
MSESEDADIPLADLSVQDNSQTKIFAERYEPARLRRPVSIADLGREGTALYHSFGNDLSRRGNLNLIEDSKLVYCSGNAVVFDDIRTSKKEFLLSVDDGGLGCVAVHPQR